MALSDFYRGETKKFYGVITYNGETPDITSDRVSFVMKNSLSDSDAEAVIYKEADTSAGDGRYDVTLSKDDTNIAAGTYYYELTWKRANGEEYVLEQGRVKVKERVEDVPGS